MNLNDYDDISVLGENGDDQMQHNHVDDLVQPQFHVLSGTAPLNAASYHALIKAYNDLKTRYNNVDNRYSKLKKSLLDSHHGAFSVDTLADVRGPPFESSQHRNSYAFGSAPTIPSYETRNAKLERQCLTYKTELSARQEEILHLNDSVARLKQKLKQKEENEQRLAEQLATLKKGKSTHEKFDLNSSIEVQFAVQRGDNADKILDENSIAELERLRIELMKYKAELVSTKQLVFDQSQIIKSVLDQAKERMSSVYTLPNKGSKGPPMLGEDKTAKLCTEMISLCTDSSGADSYHVCPDDYHSVNKSKLHMNDDMNSERRSFAASVIRERGISNSILDNEGKSTMHCQMKSQNITVLGQKDQGNQSVALSRNPKSRIFSNEISNSNFTGNGEYTDSEERDVFITPNITNTVNVIDDGVSQISVRKEPIGSSSNTVSWQTSQSAPSSGRISNGTARRYSRSSFKSVGSDESAKSYDMTPFQHMRSKSVSSVPMFRPKELSPPMQNCPACNRDFPQMGVSDFQQHVLECMDSQDSYLATRPTTPGSESVLDSSPSEASAKPRFERDIRSNSSERKQGVPKQQYDHGANECSVCSSQQTSRLSVNLTKDRDQPCSPSDQSAGNIMNGSKTSPNLTHQTSVEAREQCDKATLYPSKGRKCQICNFEFPDVSSDDEIQAHVLRCTENYSRPPDRVCPMCQKHFPDALPEADFIKHVDTHFDEFEVVDFA